MTPMQAARKLRDVQREIHREAVLAVQKAMRRVKVDARQLSSGTLSLADLRRRDHPYARRHGPLGNVGAMPGGDPAVVNRHRGQFYDAWQLYLPVISSPTISGKLVNASDVADYLQFGTKTMAPRTIAQALEGRARFYGEQEVSRAMRALETKYR
jgi:hypothetical protein